MYPSPIPEIQTTEKSADMAKGQFLYTAASSPTLQAPQVVQIPQSVPQSVASDAAIGLQYQMASESHFYHLHMKQT